tara:strand:+ start:1374 stop:1688 length:315 start_codon:yes stop_codon:yes gene_type:complete
MDFTDEQIKELLDRYVRTKEYRRVYYNKKYKNDEKYRNYVRDYNKKRYEDRKYDKLLLKGNNKDTLELNRAYSLKNYFNKTNRLEEFKKKYPNEYNLINTETTT